MDLLATKGTPKDLRKALGALPNTLENMYCETMQRVTDQTEFEKQLGLRVLSWVSWASRPLKPKELQHALAVEDSQRNFDDENIVDEDLLLSSCAGLVTLDRENGDIRLIHYTAEQYLRTQFPAAHEGIAKTCLTYLSFNVFSQGYCCNDQGLSSRLESYPFLEYAAVNWGYHAHSTSENEIENSILEFLNDDPKMSCAIQVMKIRAFTRHFRRKGFRLSKGTLKLWMASYFGLQGIVKKSLTASVCIGAKDSCTSTALHAASMNGHEAIVRLLLERGANVEAKNWSRETPLHKAAHNGYASVALLLIESGANLESKDNRKRTALHVAALAGRVSMVRLLLDMGANVAAKDDSWQQAHHVAASSGHEAIIELLLKKEVDINTRDIYGNTALHLTAASGNLAVTRFLLAHGANAAAKGNHGATVLHTAVLDSQEVITHMLLQEGISTNEQDDEGMTPLHAAVQDGKHSIVKLLLDYRADAAIKDGEGHTPLDLAIEKGSKTIIKLLQACSRRNRQKHDIPRDI